MLAQVVCGHRQATQADHQHPIVVERPAERQALAQDIARRAALAHHVCGHAEAGQRIGQSDPIVERAQQRQAALEHRAGLAVPALAEAEPALVRQQMAERRKLLRLGGHGGTAVQKRFSVDPAGAGSRFAQIPLFFVL